MHAPELLKELFVLLAIAAAGAALFERFRLPSIAGFLVMGAIAGPGGLGVAADAEGIQAIAEFGVVFLLFEIGLELPLDRVRRLLRLGLAAGALQVGGCLLGVTAVSMALGLEARTALVLGALVAMSSTALVVRMLGERGEINSPHGQITIATLLFQDLCIVPFLLAVPILATPGPIEAGPVAWATFRAVVAVGAFFLVARFVLPEVLAWAARLRSREVFTLVAVLVVVGAAFAAESIGLTAAIGAFLAGLVLSSSPWGPQLLAEVLPLRGLLLGIFFTAVGMLLDLGIAFEQAATVLLILAAAVPLKALLVAGAVSSVVRTGARVGLLSGLALAQTGEFSFVLVQATAGTGLLSDELAQSFIAASVISLIISPFVVRAGAPLVDRWTRKSKKQGQDDPDEGESGHAVLVGYGLAGRNLARTLEAVGVPFAAVEANPVAAQEARKAGANVIWGDATRGGLLEQLGVERARLVAVAISDPVATRQVVERVRSIAPEARILARTRYVLEIDALEAAGATRVVAEELEGAIDLVAQALHELAIPEGSIARFCAELRDEGYSVLRQPAAVALDPWLTELLDQLSTEWLELPENFEPNQSLADLNLRARTGVNVLAIERSGATTPSPPADWRFIGGDRLLALGNGSALERAAELLGIDRQGTDS